MIDLPDHPVIRNMERTGYPDGVTPEEPHCPLEAMRSGRDCEAQIVLPVTLIPRESTRKMPCRTL